MIQRSAFQFKLPCLRRIGLVETSDILFGSALHTDWLSYFTLAFEGATRTYIAEYFKEWNS